MSRMIAKSKIEQWTRACAVEDLPRRGGRAVRCSEVDIALFRLSHDAIAAVEDRCPHKGGKLSEGIVCDHTVICPLHGWRIDLIRGEATEPDKGCVRRFGVDVRNGEVFVNLAGQDTPLAAPLADSVGRHADTGRPKLGRRRASVKDFALYDFDRPIPVLAVEPPSPHTEETHRMRLTDLSGQSTTYSIDDLRERFPVVEFPAHIACLMFGFTRPLTWTGVQLCDVLEGIHSDYNYASFHSWETTETREGERFFETLPRRYVLDPRTLLTFGMNGGPLPKEHGGPLRLAVPFLQGYKSVKWLTDIRLTDRDEIGYKKKHGFIEFPEFNLPTSMP